MPALLPLLLHTFTVSTKCTSYICCSKDDVSTLPGCRCPADPPSAADAGARAVRDPPPLGVEGPSDAATEAGERGAATAPPSSGTNAPSSLAAPCAVKTRPDTGVSASCWLPEAETWEAGATEARAGWL